MLFAKVKFFYLGLLVFLHELEYRRLKFKKIAPRRRKTDPCEKALDNVRV